MTSAQKSPYKISVVDLVHRPGTSRELDLTVEAPEHFGEGVAKVPEGEKILITGRLDVLHDGILADMRISTHVDATCVRCLDEIEFPLQVAFQDLFAYSLDEAFEYQVHDDYVDLEPLIRDSVVMALPFQPVCRPDCPGLDPVTGERLTDMPEREPAEILDPRWAALAGFTASTDSDQQSQTEQSGAGADENK